MPTVFPTPVGVFLAWAEKQKAIKGIPHARGGVSGRDTSELLALAYSPRPWGCFPGLRVGIGFSDVFPTPVGVFLFPA